MVCPHSISIKHQIASVFSRICEIEYRIEVLDTVRIPMSPFDTVGRYIIERRQLQSTLDSLYNQWSQLESHLESLSCC